MEDVIEAPQLGGKPNDLWRERLAYMHMNRGIPTRALH